MFDSSAFRKIDDLYANMNVVKPKQASSSGGFAPRKPKPVVKYGSTCSTCGLKKAVSGHCFCDF